MGLHWVNIIRIVNSLCSFNNDLQNISSFPYFTFNMFKLEISNNNRTESEDAIQAN